MPYSAWHVGARNPIDGLDDFCRGRELQVDAADFTVPSDNKALAIFRLGERPNHRLPLISMHVVLLMFGCWAFVERATSLSSQLGNADGFVGQTDFVFKVVWQGYPVYVRQVTEKRKVTTAQCNHSGTSCCQPKYRN